MYMNSDKKKKTLAAVIVHLNDTVCQTMQGEKWWT
jgi:hypothetical protein